MTHAQKGIFFGIALGIALFVSGIGIIENMPNNDLLWKTQHEDEATTQAVIDFAIETGDINLWILTISAIVGISVLVVVGFVTGLFAHIGMGDVPGIIVVAVVIFAVASVIVGIGDAFFPVLGFVVVVIVAFTLGVATVGVLTEKLLRRARVSIIGSSLLTLLTLIVISPHLGFEFAESTSPIEATRIAMEQEIEDQQANLTQIAQTSQVDQAAQATVSALGATQTALATQVPDTLATQQAQLAVLNATATAQAPVSDSTPDNNSNVFSSVLNLLRDPAFQGLGFFVGLLSLIVAIYQVRRQQR